MKNIGILIMVLLFSGCGNKENKLVLQIDEVRKESKYDASDSLYNLFNEYVTRYPKGKMAGKYLYSSGIVKSKQGRFSEASVIFEKVYREYRDSSFAADALYNAAIQKEAIPDGANAIRLYNEFLKAFPDHPNAEIVGLNLEYVGLSDEKVAEILFKKSRVLDSLEKLNRQVGSGEN
jgi:tetratricopeptide (TPR) repeat protein